MTEPLPGEQYIPSNSSDGSIFLDGYCAECQRDKALNGTKHEDDCEPEDLCDIVARSFAGQAIEWRQVNGEVLCVRFTSMREPDGASVAVRDDSTRGLF